MKQILDHGFVDLIETWGSDQRIIEAARQSTDKGFLGWGPKCDACSCNVGYGAAQENCNQCGGPLKAGDEKLLRYLYEHKHSTPFEFAGMTIQVQAPIMVYREWHRHRTQSYAEMSARYVQMPNLHYVPSVERIIESAKKSGNRQASGGGTDLTIEQAEKVREMIASDQQTTYALYEVLLAQGISKEVARVNTPVSRYSRMYATTDLRNWLAFLTLRMDPLAQWEIQQFAHAVGDLIAEKFPRTWELFVEGKK